MVRVLVATDGSDLARHAAERALRLLDAGSTVTIARVVAPPVVPVPVPEAGLAVRDDLTETSTESLVREAQTQVAALTRELRVAGTTQVLIGDPGTELCRLASDGGYDVVVVGSHGSGFLKRVLLGSVSHHVLHHAPCPVLVVRSSDQPAEGQ